MSTTPALDLSTTSAIDWAVLGVGVGRAGRCWRGRAGRCWRGRVGRYWRGRVGRRRRGRVGRYWRGRAGRCWRGRVGRYWRGRVGRRRRGRVSRYWRGRAGRRRRRDRRRGWRGRHGLDCRPDLGRDGGLCVGGGGRRGGGDRHRDRRLHGRLYVRCGIRRAEAGCQAKESGGSQDQECCCGSFLHMAHGISSRRPNPTRLRQLGL